MEKTITKMRTATRLIVIFEEHTAAYVLRYTVPKETPAAREGKFRTLRLGANLGISCLGPRSDCIAAVVIIRIEIP